MRGNKLLFIMVFLLVIIGLVVSGFGLFYTNDGESYQTINQYGDVVKINGNGIYAHDSCFKAAINRGTDFVVFFILCPMIIICLINVYKNGGVKSEIRLVSLISVMLYYSASVVFGVLYNNLLLVYILLFSLSLFIFIISINKIDKSMLVKQVEYSFPTKGLYVLLVVSGLALFAAWMPDIINGLISNRPIELIEVYTTEITYVIDMGIISPTIFICIFLLRNKKGVGYILLQVILSCCGIIGLMIISQTVFHSIAGINHPLPVLIIKIGIFVILSFFSFLYSIKFMKAIKQ